jgi:hypothetical protein
VRWINGGAHIFVAENRAGLAAWLDPQNGNLDVTSYFQNAHFEVMIVRIDDLLPNGNALEFSEGRL